MPKFILALAVMALSFTACSKPALTSFVQTNNEGIFIKARPSSVSLEFKNPSNIATNLDKKLIAALESKGYHFVAEGGALTIRLNLVDFRKFAYTQRINNHNYAFFYGPFMRVDYDVEVENYYLMQANIEMSEAGTSQRTSLIARTAYLAGLEESKDELENKIVAQIMSFFY